jgi:hypothetical protein
MSNRKATYPLNDEAGVSYHSKQALVQHHGYDSYEAKQIVSGMIDAFYALRPAALTTRERLGAKYSQFKARFSPRRKSKSKKSKSKSKSVRK